jgi:transposase-like protein
MDALRQAGWWCSVRGMASHRAEWWAERIEELARGGDAEDIARRHGVRSRTLIWWRSELRRRARELTTGPRLLPVVVGAMSPSSTAVAGDVELVVEIGRARMTLRGALTAEHLAALVTASAQAC